MEQQNSLQERKNKENKKKSVWSFFGSDESEDRMSVRMGPETDELNTIKTLIAAYFKIVKRNLFF